MEPGDRICVVSVDHEGWTIKSQIVELIKENYPWVNVNFRGRKLVLEHEGETKEIHFFDFNRTENLYGGTYKAAFVFLPMKITDAVRSTLNKDGQSNPMTVIY